MSSSLNPDAPEFHPLFNNIIQDGYTKVSKSIITSYNWPSGASFDIFKTFTDFNIISYSLSENIIEQTNQILFTELSGTKLKRNDYESNIEKIIDANDNMLDRVNIHIDTICGVNNSSQRKFMQALQSPIISQIKVGSTTFIGATNIPRPQFLFKDTIDNSHYIWKPIITEKPNSITPLNFRIQIDDFGNITGYEHPYHMELKLYEPNPKFMKPDLEPPKFPPPLEETKFTFVDKEAQLDEMLKHLYSVDEIAIDLEHHSYRSYQGITCLMQISTDVGGDFIIDTLAIREHIHKLNVIFTDPKKLKVFHGADNDVLWLQRDFGIYLVGLFDTYRAAKTLNLSGLSLKYLLMRYCNIQADKTYQMADWRIRPLPDVLIAYARMDTHYLLYVWRLMKSELLKTQGGESPLLAAVFEASRKVCESTYKKKVIDKYSHIPLYTRSHKNFTSRQMSVLKKLYKWRDTHARELDESDQYLIPDHVLLKISEELPLEMEGILACCTSVPPFVKQHVFNIHKIILTFSELPNEPLKINAKSASDRTDLKSTEQLKYYCNFHDMTKYSNFRCSENNNRLLDSNINALDSKNSNPDVKAFKPETNENISSITDSNFNTGAKLFFPPYTRYSKYRILAKREEIKDFKEGDAKVIAIGKGNEFILKEVITKLQQVQTQIAQEDNQIASTSNTVRHNNNSEQENKIVQRKRKISIEKSHKNKNDKSVAVKRQITHLKSEDGEKK